MIDNSRFDYDELLAIRRALNLELSALHPKYERAKRLAEFPRLDGSIEAYNELPQLSQKIETAERAAAKAVHMLQHHPKRPRGLL